MPNSEPTQVLSADERVRRVFEDLILADARGEGGMSHAALARALGVSPAQLSRILAGERYVHPGQIEKLPERVYRAVMNAIEAGRRAVGAKRTPASRTRRLTAMVGTHNALVDEFEADGDIDAREAAALRVSLNGIRMETEDGQADFADVVPMKAGVR